jgi:deazaflavin-dependent oxidoreductase (nitroreductase family)
MSFNTRNGTRGGRPPSGRLLRWINNFNINRFSRKDSKFLVLTSVGAKTGAQRQTPVAWFPDGQDSWLIVASAAGAQNNPAWYYNIAAHPNDVQIEMAGRRIAVSAEQLHGPARDRAWHQITTTEKRFAKYEHKTDRELPVIRLRTRSTLAR